MANTKVEFLRQIKIEWKGINKHAEEIGSYSEAHFYKYLSLCKKIREAFPRVNYVVREQENRYEDEVEMFGLHPVRIHQLSRYVYHVINKLAYFYSLQPEDFEDENLADRFLTKLKSTDQQAYKRAREEMEFLGTPSKIVCIAHSQPELPPRVHIT